MAAVTVIAVLSPNQTPESKNWSLLRGADHRNYTTSIDGKKKWVKSASNSLQMGKS